MPTGIVRCFCFCVILSTDLSLFYLIYCYAEIYLLVASVTSTVGDLKYRSDLGVVLRFNGLAERQITRLYRS